MNRRTFMKLAGLVIACPELPAPKNEVPDKLNKELGKIPDFPGHWKYKDGIAYMDMELTFMCTHRRFTRVLINCA